MKRVLTVCVIPAALLTVAGCGSSTPSAPTAPPPSATATAPSESPDASTSPAGDVIPMGQQGNSAGLKMTVTKVTVTRTLRYSESGKTLTAPSGGNYVLVQTTGMNDTKKGIDLTCSYPAKTLLFDQQGREFETGDLDLYELKGNPGCNDDVQPGFPFNMTWAYLIPPGATPTKWQYESISEKLESGPIVTVSPLTVT